MKSSGTIYWGGGESGALAETDLSGNIQHEYVFFNGKRQARVDLSDDTMHFYFADHLGSTSDVTDAVGNIRYESDYYPYGGEIPVITGDSNHYKFNGKERDTESGLDEFGARYYASSLGRFTIPDWAAKPTAVPYAHYGNPQSLNLYSYVQNNPTTLGDPDGHQEDDSESEVPGAGPPRNARTGEIDPYADWDNGLTREEPDAEPPMEAHGAPLLPPAANGDPANRPCYVDPKVAQAAKFQDALNNQSSKYSNDLNRSSSTKQTGAQGQKTETTVKDQAGSTTYKTEPGKTGGQSTYIVRKDANGKTVYVKQEARTNSRDFTKEPDHVHYYKPKDKEVR